ncbi:2-succinyl-5-enolpyruvyl-6-hydroxy-3-cyclohexene-1-carboxylic-acid synthase [Arthrospiribacter ruber]|uniref:2-succinyl-5-enolpyruvyl-6-hydroxy-3-cyclohexene-1-carboxylate synthase n=1 Tax=Arthrospiribacter ruber TaxID=2487934 RepID=A0A951ITD2_9BACT|nr:2-succinyl-5-enolpyruvyl-6-hydroxy-3-cyclohexene-1-carboxylic-acid synthase [Arthrospiribacter ruber]MBW3466282.1 2-succinyl-5-enolpyruvyl-6-hydroxy-3-cyclohexene-1-carboxylic-acid synthase [Arthrospiribacter ruber]
MPLQPIADLVSICVKQGITDVILSPGSRCAPISLAFVRHPKVHARTISDERSAAFIALGMAQQSNRPVVLVCTSGSAAYNYAPAVAEAFFQQIPLIIITADRPPEWIDQWDGQTIRQTNIYGQHVKASYNFPDEFGHHDKIWHGHRICNEAILSAMQFPQGPVHLNVPLREPFYPEKGESFEFDREVNVTSGVKTLSTFADETKEKFKERLANFKRVVIIPGQQRPDKKLADLLNEIASSKNAVIITDTISNFQSDVSVNFHDHFISAEKFKDQLEPDLIITFGKSIISKGLKLFLRKSNAQHWHIQPGGYTPDTFQKLGKIIPCNPLDFLENIKGFLQSDRDFVAAWSELDQKVSAHLPPLVSSAAFGEYKAISSCLNFIPHHAKLHLANSMAVRYVNFLGKRPQEIICNRGTSGIDGSNSTAVGCTFTTKDPVVLITGDMAFFYDRNAFWHNYAMPNLRIILLNNHAGGIFRLIEGPSKQPELEEYFETKQALEASYLANEYGFGYFKATDELTLEEGLRDFFKKSIKPKILEIITDSPKNAEVLKKIKSSLNEIL